MGNGHAAGNRSPTGCRQPTRGGQTATGGLRAAAALEADRKELVKVATRLKTPQTETALRGAVSFQGQRFKAALASLADDGTLQPAEIVKGNNRAYPAWTLRQTDEKKIP